MQNKRYSGYIIGGVILIIVLFLSTNYNSLVNKEEMVKLQWNEVQNAYQRRTDFIPNVVNVVKGQANFEQTTLQQVTEARAKVSAVTVSGNDLTADKFNQQIAAQDGLAAATNRLLIKVEKYPELQGAAAFKGLQTQLEGTERRIKVARKDFNAAIADYNNAIRGFPSKLTAAIFGFKVREGFQSNAGADRSVEIKF